MMMKMVQTQASATGIKAIKPLNRPGLEVLLVLALFGVVFGVLIGFIFGVGVMGE